MATRDLAAVTATAGADERPSPVDEARIARATIRRVTLRLMPFLFLLFVCNYIDRTNLSIAALQMNRDLRFSSTAYGLGAGIFFIGYALFEVPSNLMLARFGARRWIARIVITWGLIACAMMFVRTPREFYLLRFLLGLAEAGFFPGMVYYLGQWFPAPQRARAIARLAIAVPIAAMIGNPLGGMLLGLDGRLGLRGWQWLFLFEGIPSIVLGVVTLRLLTDGIEQARWLSSEQRTWLAGRLREERERPEIRHDAARAALAHPTIWLSAGLYFLVMMASYGYLFWSPMVIRDALRTTPVATGLITGGMAAFATLGILTFGASSDRTGDRFLHMVGAAGLAGLGYCGAALVADPLVRVACLALVLTGAQGFGVAFWCLPTKFLRGGAAAAGIALVNSFGNLGGLASNYLIGRVRDATGSTSEAFLMLAGLAFGAALLSLMLRRQAVFAPPSFAGARIPALEGAVGD